MKAIILAGGKGTRLAPYTTVLPKPLMPIGDIPILDIVLHQLANNGFTDITLAVGHLAELLMAYCGDGAKYNLSLTYSHEETPRGTAGPITLIPNLNETFLIMNGDLLTNINYRNVWDYHKQRNALATIATYKRDVKIDLGVIEIDDNNWATNYIEKPTYHYDVSMGIYIFEPAIIQYIPKNERFDLPDLILRLFDVNEQVNCFRFDGYWLDIGRHDDYEAAIQEFQSHRSRFLPEG